MHPPFRLPLSLLFSPLSSILLFSKVTPVFRAASYWARASELTVEHYKLLLDRGWRRSGLLLYKPDLAHSCCPHYTIRLDATTFRASKCQRKALHRWSKHVLGSDYIYRAKIRYRISREEKTRRKNQFDLFESVHGCEYSGLKRPPEPSHRFEVSLEPNIFTDEKFALYSNYQRVVHHDSPADISPSGFRRFLCASPLKRKTVRHDGAEQLLGSYHQCYRLDGRLVAFGVLDLLPGCVSAVYFVYHEDMIPWKFGKLGALREAALAAEGGYKYYYMGFYIHTCPKMRYKREYRRQDVLDPESYAWDPLDAELLRKLDARKYISLSRDRRLAAAAAVTTGSATAGSAVDQPGATSFAGINDGGQTIASSTGSLAADNDDDEDDGGAARSLFKVAMPGVMPVDEVLRNVDLGQIMIRLVIRSRPTIRPAQDLLAWDGHAVDEPRSFKGAIAELAAAVGPRVAREMVVDLGSV